MPKRGKLRFARDYSYPKYNQDPRMTLSPTRLARGSANLKIISGRDESKKRYYNSYPSSSTLAMKSVNVNASDNLKTTFRNQTSNPLARGGSPALARRSRSQKISCSRVSFADGTRPGLPDDHTDKRPRMRVERHCGTHPSTPNGSTTSLPKRRASRISDHHYNLGVPADSYVKFRKFIPFFPISLKTRFQQKYPNPEVSNLRRQRGLQHYANRRHSRQSRRSKRQHRSHRPKFCLSWCFVHCFFFFLAHSTLTNCTYAFQTFVPFLFSCQLSKYAMRKKITITWAVFFVSCPTKHGKLNFQRNNFEVVKIMLPRRIQKLITIWKLHSSVAGTKITELKLFQCHVFTFFFCIKLQRWKVLTCSQLLANLYLQLNTRFNTFLIHQSSLFHLKKRILKSLQMNTSRSVFPNLNFPHHAFNLAVSFILQTADLYSAASMEQSSMFSAVHYQQRIIKEK